MDKSIQPIGSETEGLNAESTPKERMEKEAQVEERYQSRRFALKMAAAGVAGAMVLPKIVSAGSGTSGLSSFSSSSTNADELLDIERLVTHEMNQAVAVGLPTVSADNLNLVVQRARALTGLPAAWNCFSTFATDGTCISSLCCIWDVIPDAIGSNDPASGAALGALTNDSIAKAGGVENAAQSVAQYYFAHNPPSAPRSK